VIFADRATTGDGILTAVRFLSLAARRGVSVRELAGVMRRFPQVIVNVPVARREGVQDSTGIQTAVADAERSLGDGGRVVVRASGTENLVRVMVEAEEEPAARAHAEAIAAVVGEQLGA
jgi:phosphoglucosamine mutase